MSLVLAVKNGLPHLRKTIDALNRQTYGRWELVVQDGASTDGTLEYLSTAGIENMRLESGADAGVGDAYNRALVRSTGDLVCFVASDEYLEDDALERGVAWFSRFPDALFVNGAVRLIDANDDPIEIFQSPHFDLVSHLKCETVLPFAGLLDRAKLGPDCFFDASLKTCPDYDFWIRLGSRFAPDQFVVVKEVFKTARADRASMSFRPESFTHFCRDKAFVLNRFLDAQPPSPLIESLQLSALAGIYLWAAESLFALEGASPEFFKWCREAARVDPWSARLRRLALRSDAFVVDESTGQVIEMLRQPDAPCGDRSVVAALDLRRTSSSEHWLESQVASGPPIQVRTSPEAWAYAAEVPVPPDLPLDDESWYWVRIELEVLSGQVGVGRLIDHNLRDERLIGASQGCTTAFVKINRAGGSILIRNGALNKASTVRLLDAAIESCRK